MIGTLNNKQINKLLAAETIGRIGCLAGNRVYVVPVSYGFDGKDIYVHTYEGVKTQAMRSHPEVCFEVDDIRDMGHWQSVIGWGIFEELHSEKDRNYAIKILMSRPLPVISSITTHLGAIWPFYDEDAEKMDSIFFRIRLEELTGKYEMSTDFVDETRIRSVML
jgi:uncharacterized protein